MIKIIKKLVYIFVMSNFVVGTAFADITIQTNQNGTALYNTILHIAPINITVKTDNRGSFVLADQYLNQNLRASYSFCVPINNTNYTIKGASEFTATNGNTAYFGMRKLFGCLPDANE